MAEHLASIFGTEKDRVNCPFYFKVCVWVVNARSSCSSSVGERKKFRSLSLLSLFSLPALLCFCRVTRSLLLSLSLSLAARETLLFYFFSFSLSLSNVFSRR